MLALLDPPGLSYRHSSRSADFHGSLPLASIEHGRSFPFFFCSISFEVCLQAIEYPDCFTYSLAFVLYEFRF